MSDEAKLRADLCRWAKSLFDRGLSPGSSGNISCRLADGYLATPTNSCLGFLDPARLSRLDREGHHIAGDKPTKELPLHLAFYRARPGAGAVVHLHSTFATAISCLADIDPRNAIPPLTPYVAMRVGAVPVLPYTHPGSTEVAPLIETAAVAHAAVLLENHGPVVSAPTLDAAVFAAEELEETAKLAVLTHGRRVRLLSEATVAELNAMYRLR
jgi:ribulose-5-phosphate 4-epimerase/fuculose-1-phosphate aldolase